MMTPIYFPFTYIPETIAKPLSRFLGRLIVFQPVLNNQPEALRRLEDNGCIDIRVPYSDDEESLNSCLKEFKEWGRLHQGDEASLKDIFKNGFSRKTFTSQIRTDILKNQSEAPFVPDSVFLDRLFLLMAQELDSQQAEIDHDLASSIDDELDLFTHMTGEEKILDPPKERLFKNDYGSYMTASRMAAWSSLLNKNVRDSAFFVTSSRAVLDEVLGNIDRLEKVGEFDNISCDQPEPVRSEFFQFLMHLATKPWESQVQLSLPDFISGPDRKINFKLYILLESDQNDICNFFIKDKKLPKSNENKWLNMLIGYFEI